MLVSFASLRPMGWQQQSGYCVFDHAHFPQHSISCLSHHISHRLYLFPLKHRCTLHTRHTPSININQAHSIIMNPLKKFVVAAVLLLAGTQSVAAKPTFVGSLGGINTLLDFRVEVDAANACDAGAYSDGSVTRGLASVYPPFLKKIEKEFGHGTIHPTALMEEAVHQVQTKRFTETTQLHRDSYTNEHGVRQTVGEDGKVGFIFRNTNEDAHFETDDDGGFCFPAVKGTFMTFDGSIPHQTIVKSGHVELIGPFLLSSKALFGVGECGCFNGLCLGAPLCCAQTSC